MVSSIRALLPSLRLAEQRVARVVLADPLRVADETIDRLAERAGTSTATVTRFYRSIGLSGFAQLRVRLATEVGRRGVVAAEMGSGIEKGDDLARVVAKVSFAGAQAIQDTATQLNLARLGEVIDRIERASRVELYGAGASALVTADLQQKLYRIGRVCYAWSEAHLARTGAALLRPGDVAIGFSHSGDTDDTVRSLGLARRYGATTVAVTNHSRSAITQEADIALFTESHEVNFRAAATSSRHAQLAIVDYIFMGLAHRTFDESRKALGETYLAVHGELLGE